MKRADEVLTFREVHRGLAADRGVDLGKEARRHLHDIDATVVHGGREARGVSDDAAAERHHEVITQQPADGERTTQVLDSLERLGRLTITDRDDPRVGAEPRAHAVAEDGEEMRLGDHHRPAATEHDPGELVERACTDEHVVCRFNGDGHAAHRSTSSSTASTTCSISRSSVGTATSATAS